MNNFHANTFEATVVAELPQHLYRLEVSRAFGVFDTDGGFATRGTFLLDRDGVVRWRMLNGPGDARDFGSYREALAGLRADAARA